MKKWQTSWYYVFTSLLLLAVRSANAQSLPVGTPFLEGKARYLQTTGRIADNHSFMIRPLHASTMGAYDSLLFPANDSAKSTRFQNSSSPSKLASLRLLPIVLRQQFNSHHPYGWNDGAMIPAKGYQTLVTAGVHARLGLLSVQLQPELLWAANPAFNLFPQSHSDSIWYHYYQQQNWIDAPESFGSRPYTKLFPGQSSIRLNFKKVSFGLSSQNLWWGPGMRNSLLMSNTAPGFLHFTFNTTAPVATRIGSFEWQVVAGRLQGSGVLPQDTARRINNAPLYIPKLEDDRYLNAFVVTWQPKGLKGLYLGLSRAFYQYANNVPPSLNGYFPVLSALFKGKAQDENSFGRDQLLSFYFRLCMPESKAELYGEYGRNDHSADMDDFLQEPEHARAYILGFRKFFTTAAKKELELYTEFTQLQRSATRLVRMSMPWYTHYQVRHGYTHRGQMLGAGIGPGSSSQTIGVNWYQGINKNGFMLERVVRNNDFYFDAFTGAQDFGRHWVDLSLSYKRSWQRGRCIFSGNASLVRSYNYQWRTKGMPEGKKDITQLHLSFGAGYIL